jgi:hypothetical protein
MSSLWTPDGEHPVGAGGPAHVEHGDAVHDAVGDEDAGVAFEDLSPEEQAEVRRMAEELAEVQREVAATPAATIVANHLMGFYELGAIHLSQDPPNFAEAAVAIDAMAGVVEKLPGRLGENEQVLRDALAQIRMAFVSLKNASA